MQAITNTRFFMKHTLFIFSFLLVVPFVGCKVKKDSANKATATNNSPLKGTWYLTHSSGGFAGTKEHIPHGEVQWTFMTEDSTVVVENNFSGKPMTYTVIKSGTYGYSVLNKNDQSYLFVNDKELGAFRIEKERLVIDENKISWGSAADRFLLQFER